MSNFRPVEFWKTSVMLLPDNAFFELLRTVSGKIKTPFNKQLLMNDLEKFLLRNEIQQNIAAYIDDNDSRIIAAVAALNEPAHEELETFFAGELSYAELYDIIVNLEERFIIYRFVEKEQNRWQTRKLSRLALNPVLEPVLSGVIEDRSLMFPSIPANEMPKGEMTDNADETPKPYLFDDRIFAALLSFVSQNKLFFKYGGGIRQKVINAAKTLLPGLPLETAIGSLQVLGLFFAKDETLTPDYHRFAAFGGLDRQGRMEYFAAGIACHEDLTPSDELSSWLIRTKVQGYATSIHRLYNSLDSERLYPHATLQKLAFMLEGKDSGGINTSGKDTSGINAGSKFDLIIGAMKKAGLLVQVSHTYWRTVPCTETAAQNPVIVMDSPGTFVLYPEIAYNDAIDIAAVSCVIEAGSSVRFELSRDSAVAAFDRGISAASIIELLQRSSHNRIDENLIFSLRDWEKRHKEVTLRRGLVLTLSPEHCYLADTRPLAKLITDTLAPGIYMLAESSEEKAAEVLRRAGVTIIAHRNEDAAFGSDEYSGGPLRNFFPQLYGDQTPVGESRHSRKTHPAAVAAPVLIRDFHSILNDLHLAKDEQDELAARIDRKLILCDFQLKNAAVRYEKLEARGLDYVGKALIAKQAISLQTPVEVIWPGKQKQEHVFGIPKALEKAGGESILVIDSAGDDIIRVPLGKISLLRRIKKSIFGSL